MKKIILIVTFFTLFLSNAVFAQFEPYSDGAKLLSAGVGATAWGIPIYVRYEHPIAENITVGGVFSFQSHKERNTGTQWRHSIVGFGARGSYHFNELMGVTDEWDFYAGANLGFYSWNTSIDGSSTSPVRYAGNGTGGLSLGIHAGARYFIQDNLAVNAELGGGNILSGLTVGVTFVL